VRASNRDRLFELAGLFTRLGFTAFGGPAAHIAMMHDEVVVRRRWIEEQHFLDMIGAVNLVPGPNSTELALHIGQVRAGWRGLLVAGFSFILPAVLIVGVCAWAYVAYGSTPQAGAILYGVKPVIVAIVVQALWRLGRSALKTPLLAAAAAGVLLFYLLGVNELLLLFGVGALAAAGGRLWRRAVWALPGLGVVGLEDEPTLSQLFGVFLKAGALLYGSGYVLLAFLHNDLVVQLGWLTHQQLLDAVAVGQFTPGPVFTTATFVGYVVAGVPGALVATFGIFLPSFFLVAGLGHIVPWLRRTSWSAALLDGVNAAALGLMAGVSWQLGQTALLDWLTVLLAVGSWVVLMRWRINSAWLVAAGAGVGLLQAIL
jgi:chromate transporter